MSRKMPRAMLPLWRCKSTSFLSSEVNMSVSMHLLLRVDVMHDFICTGFAKLCGTGREQKYRRHSKECMCRQQGLFYMVFHVYDSKVSPNSKQSRYFNSGYEDAFGLLLFPICRRSHLEKGPLIDLFLRRPWSTSGRIWPKSLNAYAGPGLLHPYQVWSTSINLFCRKGYVFPYIYMH